MSEETPEETPFDSLSTASEASAAVVSLYQSWAGSSLCGSAAAVARAEGKTPTPVVNTQLWWDPSQTTADDDITLLELEDDAEDATWLKQALMKRLRRVEDLPSVPALRPQKRARKPVCHFLNYMGSRRDPNPPPTPEEPPHLWHTILGLEESDALFPMAVEDSPATKTTTTTATVSTAKQSFAMETVGDKLKKDGNDKKRKSLIPAEIGGP
jgi:hypothetical protein